MTDKIKNIIIEDESDISENEVQYNNLDGRLQSSIDLANYLVQENISSKLLKEEYFGYGARGLFPTVTNRIGIKPDFLFNIEGLKNIVIKNTSLTYDIHVSFFAVKNNTTAIYNSGWITSTNTINVLNYPTAKYMSFYIRNKNDGDIDIDEIENFIDDVQIYFISNNNESDLRLDNLLKLIDNNVNIKHSMLDSYLKEQLYTNMPEYSLTNNYYISNRGISSASGYSYSSPIELLKNQTVVFYGKGYLTNVCMIAECNSEGGSISQKVYSDSSDLKYYSYTPNTDTYIILSGKTDSFNSVIIYDKIVNYNTLFSELKLNDKIDDLNIIKNNNIIFNRQNITSQIIDGYYIRHDNGNQGSLANTHCTDYIELKYNNCNAKIKVGFDEVILAYSPDLRGLAFYNSQKNYISGIQYPKDTSYIDFSIPDNAKYIRLTITNSMYSNFDFMYTDLKEIIDKKTNGFPLDNIIADGGMMNIFQKIVCIGDSLTRGQFESNNTGTVVYNNEDNYSYPAHLKRILNNTSVKTFAKGGACASNSTTSVSDNHSWLDAFAADCFTNENKAECYIIALGTNDIGYYNSFNGTVSTDIDLNNYTNNARNSVGGYAQIIQRIIELQPKAKIFCVGIPATRNTLSTRTAANEKISDICDLFSNCYYLDMQTYGVQPEGVAEYKAVYYMGGHRSSQGYYQSAKEVSTYIDYIIKKNPNDFKQIPFIGTDLSFN